MINTDNIVDVESEMLYYDVQGDVVTMFSIITYLSGWKLGLISRVAVSGEVLDFKFITQGNTTIH